MPSLRPVKAKELIKTLSKAGFLAVRQKGSHVLLKNEKGNSTVIPIHAGEEIDRHLLKKILRDCNLDIPDYFALLEK